MAALHQHIERLARDDMRGRSPGTLAAPRYIAQSMQAIGLSPAGDDGFLATVPLRGTSVEQSRFELGGSRSARSRRWGSDALVASSMGAAGTRERQVPMVFVGYGVDTTGETEAVWNDYASVDVTGALVVVLPGDPPVDDPRFGFDGPTLSAHGRWDTKFATALAHGAWGCVIVHDPRIAGYDWSVVEASWGGERFALRGGSTLTRERAALELPALELQGFLALAAAEDLAQRNGASVAQWRSTAAEGHASTPLHTDLRASFTVVARELEDHNVIGRLEGKAADDPGSPAAPLVVTAHWDHLGVRVSSAGERVLFPGAMDNATGVAGLLEVARALADLETPLPQPLLFIATAAEEHGLLGSRHFVRQRASRNSGALAAVVNLESLSIGAAQPLEYLVSASTTASVTASEGPALGEMFVRAVQRQGRAATPLRPDPSGAYFRTDQFSFAAQGVPALTFWPAPDPDSVEGRTVAAERAARYHSIADHYDPAWTLEGARDDCDAVLWLLTRWQ